MPAVKKVVVIGPESTGKSTLCSLLASYFGTIWCPEYAREYLLENGTQYSIDDLLIIAKGQLQLEKEYLDKAATIWSEQQAAGTAKSLHPLLLVDTDMYVMKVWSEFVFDRCHNFILDEVVNSTCDLYLLSDIDLPWIKDELREYPDYDRRLQLFHIYRDLLIHQQVPWATISGNYQTRFEKAKQAIEGLLL